MNYVVAPDSFKGSLSAVDAALAIRRGILLADPAAKVVLVPIADGGEGTLEAFLANENYQRHDVDVTHPLGGKVNAAFGLSAGDHPTAIVEMAQAAGLGLIPLENRNPGVTTTYGVGELILAAVELGVTEVIVGLGGSCTNDGGAGALQALGVRFLDVRGEPIPEPISGSDLGRIAHIDCSQLPSALAHVKFILASDVTNPLIGELGASRVFGLQKGASPEQVLELDLALTHFAGVIVRDLCVDIANRAGGGAAGGLGAGLMAFLGAEMKSGIDLVLDMVGFNSLVQDADYVFTGEGRIDSQTLHGKAVMGVLNRCSGLDAGVIAFGGSVDHVAEKTLIENGLLCAVPLVNGPMSLSDAIKNAADLLEAAAERTVRLLLKS